MHKVLRLPQVIEKVALKKTIIYDMMKKGKFPKNFPLGLRARGWDEEEINRWIDNQRGTTNS
jgi:prophage regulatory protein